MLEPVPHWTLNKAHSQVGIPVDQRVALPAAERLERRDGKCDLLARLVSIFLSQMSFFTFSSPNRYACHSGLLVGLAPFFSIT